MKEAQDQLFELHRRKFHLEEQAKAISTELAAVDRQVLAIGAFLDGYGAAKAETAKVEAARAEAEKAMSEQQAAETINPVPAA